MSTIPADEAADTRRQERYQQLLESLGESYFETDLSGKLTEFNDYICAFHGRTRDELGKLTFRDYIPSDQAQVIFDAFHRVYQTGRPSPVLTYDVIRKDGTLGTAETVTTLRRDSNGDPIGFCGISRDVTEKAKTENALRESEESYRRIMELSPEMIAITRASDSVIVVVNDAFCRCTGFDREEIVGRTGLDLGLIGDPEIPRKIIEEIEQHGKIEHTELSIRDKQGSIHDTLLSSQFISFKGEDCFLGILTDISELKATQRALEEREKRYLTILEAFPYSVTITRLSDSRYVEVNKGFTQRTGYTAEEVIGRSSLEINIFKNLDERKRLREGIINDGRVDGMEITFQGKNGRITETMASARRIQYEGEACLLFISADVGDLKKTQRALIESEESHRAILEAAPYSIAISRISDWTYVQVNARFCQRTGYSKEEVIGRTSTQLGLYIDPEDRQRFIDAFRQEGQVDLLEMAYKAKDGHLLETMVGARPMRFKGEDCILTISSDISELKKAQRALRQSEESYRTIMQAAPYSITISRVSDGRFIEINDAFTQRTGYTREEVIGRTSMDLNIYRDINDSKRLRKLFLDQGKVDNVEIQFRTKDGHFTNSLASACPIRYHGEDCFLFISSNIDSLKEAQKALSEREESYRTILDTAPYTIVITRLSDSKYVEVNTAYCRRTGYSREEALGFTPFDLNLYENPTDRERMLQTLRLNGQVEGMEVRFRNKAGQTLESMISSSPIRYKGEDCVLTMTVDINALKQTQRALEESEARFRTIFETAADPIFLTDAESGSFIDVNRAACRHLGYERDEFFELSLKDINDPDAPDPLTELIEQPSGDAPLFFEAIHMRKDGSIAIVEVSSQFMVHQGRHTLLSIVRDVTRRKENEAELKRYRSELEQMVAERTRELEAAQSELVKSERLAVLGQLTATVSHELRNPLGVIRSSNFYLQRKIKDRDKKTDKHFNRIEDQITICDAIVADLLEYTRGRHASITTEDPTPWLQQVVDQIEEQEGIEISLQLDDKVQPVPHDQEKMRRVIINVLLNAIHAVRARAENGNGTNFQPRIELSAIKQNEQLVFEVADNGIGMDEETRRRAFEPLFTTRARGTGIGLANVKKIIEEHSGSITLESRPGEGTRIRLSLPYSAKS